MALDDLLQRNRTWAAYQTALDPEYFARHASGRARAFCGSAAPTRAFPASRS